MLGPRKRQLVYAAIGLILVFEQGSFPLNLVTPPRNNTALYVWTAANLPKDAALVHYPFDKFEADLSYLRGSLVDHKRILNGYSSFIPESIKRLQDLSQTDPASFLKICATLGINYLVIHGNYVSPTDSLAQYLKEKSLVQLATIGTDSVYDISSGKDINFHTVPTTYSSQIKNGRLTIEQKNNTSSIWVSSQVERFDIQLNFIKEGNKVGQNKSSTYKPLFLMPGESFVTSLEVSPPLFTGYDDVGIDIK